MKSGHPGLVVAIALLALGCSGSTSPRNTEPSGTLQPVGTPAAMLGELTRLKSPLRDHLALPTAGGGRIELIAQDLDFTGGYLSATGTARGSENSSFILKGDGKELYGWVVLHDQDLAYEYTTSAQGQLVVEQVPVDKIFPVCDPELDPATDGVAFDDAQALDMQPGDPPHVGAYTMGADTNKLQSNPGATKVLYMDIAALTLAKDQLWRAWQVVAGSFSAFDVNVTTDPAVFEAAEPRNRGKACTRNEAGRSSCALNAFGTTRCCNVFNKGNGYYQGATTAHELGHLMGLRHDGSAAGEYFRGLAAFRWCPIMGASTPKTSWGQDVLFQWSKGEYMGANNKEDDLAIISRNLPFKKDDVPDSKPLVIRTGGQISADDNRGLIETNTDSDTFTFTSAGGRAVLTVDRIEFVGGAFLDIEAQIQNAGGMMLARNNGMVSRKATLDVMLPAGTYQLIIKGGGEGTPQNGFSNYSSLGYYGIAGTINAAAGGGPSGPDAGADGGGGGGVDARGGGADAGTKDVGDAADAPPIDSGAGADAGGGGAGGSGGSGAGGAGGRNGSGGRSAGTGGSMATGGARPPETSRGPVSGGCAVSPGAGASSPVGPAVMLMGLVVAGRRRRRRCR